VALADKAREFGGRLRWESRLPGLGQWHRVVDYRMGQLRKLPNVSLYPESELSAEDVREFGADHVVVATGARWLPHLCGANELPAGPLVAPRVYTPDDLAAGVVPEGPVAVFDYDNYYLGSAVAESLAHLGVTYITTAGAAAAWGFMTNEQPLVHQSFAAKGITLRTLEVVTGFDGEELRLAQIFSGEERRIAVRSLVIVGYRAGGSALHEALAVDAVPGRLHLTGDANAPGAIVHAVYQGHKTARELGVANVMVRRDAPFAARDFQMPEAAE
jgi:dimethylamine/trimethylamine dehydrogenase